MPVQRVGKMVLNRNPDNFFAENEQAAFHPVILFPVWTSPTIPCCRDVCSPIPIHKSVVLVGRISMRFRLTAQPALTIISSVTACIVWGSTLTRRITNRTRSTITGRAKHRRDRNAAVLNHIRNAWKEIKFASAVHLWRILFPSASVLAKSDAIRAAPYCRWFQF